MRFTNVRQEVSSYKIFRKLLHKLCAYIQVRRFVFYDDASFTRAELDVESCTMIQSLISTLTHENLQKTLVLSTPSYAF